MEPTTTTEPVTAAEAAAMLLALEAARAPGVPQGPNPRVGCTILSPGGTVVAVGHHRGAGTPHAEVDALDRAGDAARGAAAVVTLEPCDHTGRTGPCTEALLRAGVARVVYALPDPNPVAAGGARRLREAGVDVVAGAHEDEAREVNRGWLFGLTHDRPLVTWKTATTLDGRVAARDGSSQWITSAVARRDGQRLRRGCDAVMVGTGTALRDDPSLTVRDAEDRPAPREHQPLRVVVGSRGVPQGAHLRDGRAELVQVTGDLTDGLASLHDRGIRHVLLEGGPTLAASMLRAGLVDEVVAYIAPALLGTGPGAVGDLGIGSIDSILRLRDAAVAVLGEGPELTVRVTATLPHQPTTQR